MWYGLSSRLTVDFRPFHIRKITDLAFSTVTRYTLPERGAHLTTHTTLFNGMVQYSLRFYSSLPPAKLGEPPSFTWSVMVYSRRSIFGCISPWR